MKLNIKCKCDDRFSAILYDNEGNDVGGYYGYVPRGLGIGGGDYIDLTIDTDTGIIESWVPLDAEEIKQILEIYDEDED